MLLFMDLAHYFYIVYIAYCRYPHVYIHYPHFLLLNALDSNCNMIDKWSA